MLSLDRATPLDRGDKVDSKVHGKTAPETVKRESYKEGLFYQTLLCYIKSL